ncbi:hypothetical protein OsI_02901 [Oryza sativa Indica Group]|uniref:Uncharacterized protein n=1 Tax=Oryza sativa subsp. indica TaxID=39946 RepID=A2WSQ6_ORYSI|nr:hypothetical protein OsI_02901 [Oryza sativa Indica Group]
MALALFMPSKLSLILSMVVVAVVAPPLPSSSSSPSPTAASPQPLLRLRQHSPSPPLPSSRSRCSSSPPAYAERSKPAGDVTSGGGTLLPRHAQPGEPVREAVTVEMAPETVVQAALSRKQSANSSPHSGSAQESVSPSILSKASPGREGEGRKEERGRCLQRERGKRACSSENKKEKERERV